MAKKLYVGGVPYSTTDQGLRDAFSKFGEVTSATIMMDKMTGRSRGFGFVEIADDAAEEAVQKMNGAEFEGRRLTVNEARPMVPREEYKRAPRPQGDRRSF
jgi:RNA recognition motif-containing protein